MRSATYQNWKASTEIQIEVNLSRNGDPGNMPAAISASKNSTDTPVTAGGHGVRQQASPDRRREFDHVLSYALPRFRRMAMRWLRNPEDAEDAVQDAMLSAFR